MKKTILTIIITAIICISVSVYATISLTANQVSYTDSNNNEVRLDQALDNIYQSIDSKLIIDSFGTATYQSSQGTPKTSRIINKSINKGKYIVAVTTGEGWNDSGAYSASEGVTPRDILSCSSNNCVKTKLSGYSNAPKATDPITSDYRLIIGCITYVYYVEIKNDTDTLSAHANAARDYYTGAQFVSMHVISLN